MFSFHQFSNLKTVSAVAAVLSFACSLGFAASGVGTINGDYKAVTLSGSTIIALDFDSDLFTSDDEGASFTLGESTTESFEDVAAVGSTGIAVGVDGLILRSADGGIGWSSATAPTLFGSLYAVDGRPGGVDPNGWIAVGDDLLDGVILRSTDDGQNWGLVETFTETLLEAALWTGSQWLVAGRDTFTDTGVVYYSTDGTTWAAANLPTASSPILDLASDGAGNVLAVGEGGQILRSTNDGEDFVSIATEYLGGGDLHAVVADSSGRFFIGGDEKLIIRIDGTSATTLVPAAPSAAPVLDFVLIDDVPLASGSFFNSATRTVPFTVSISSGGSLDFVLTVEESLVGKSYYVETTTDLTANDWDIVPDTSVAGTGGQLTFDLAEDGTRRFWRVVEF